MLTEIKLNTSIPGIDCAESAKGQGAHRFCMSGLDTEDNWFVIGGEEILKVIIYRIVWVIRVGASYKVTKQNTIYLI